MRVVTLVGAFAVAMTLAMAVAHVGNGSEEATIEGPDMTVNGTADNNIRDGFLTLREAMLLATGGLPVSGLAEGECNQISGAQWTPPNPPFPSLCISGLVPGASSADTILFDLAVFNPATIILSSQLPALDTGDDTISAVPASVIVNGAGAECFTITSDRNTIKGLEIYDCYNAISILTGAKSNAIGGIGPGERNVISGSDIFGVLIHGTGTDGNAVKGNYIGTNSSGTSPLRNGAGVAIVDGARNNTVGGSISGERNVIAGNEETGVWIAFAGTDGNVVRGNYIGIDASGAVAIPNGHGVLIEDGAQGNTVGGNTAAERNVISGNEDAGVLIEGTGTDGNIVSGNFIGTDASGEIAVGNVSGVRIGDGAQGSTVGGGTNGERNVISGNVWGVHVVGSTTTGSQVIGNHIGTDAAGAVALGNQAGIAIYGSQETIVGGKSSSERNIISGNYGSGVAIRDGAAYTVVQGNYIGVDAGGTAALGNKNGLTIYSHSTTVGGISPGEGNIIAYSNTEGISVDGSSSTGNTIRGNSIHSNGGSAIHNSDGGNTELTPPIITGFGSISGTACPNCTIDVYSDAEDEGRIYEGSTTPDATGNWTLTGQLFGPNATATVTDLEGNTSEFSQPASVPTPATPSPTPLSTTSPIPTATNTPGSSTGTLTGTPTATPTPIPTVTPTGSPPEGESVIWGDANCSGQADPVDSLLTLRHDAGLSANTGDCPDLGSSVGVSVASALLWGDIDCSGGIDPVDSLKLLRFDAGLSVAQPVGCPEIGSAEVVVIG